jgi:hypothetical protein
VNKRSVVKKYSVSGLKPFLKGWPFVLFLYVLILNLVLPEFPDQVEIVYSQLTYPALTALLTTLFNWLPLSVTEAAIALIVLFIPTGIALCLLKRWKWRRYLFSVVSLLSLVYAWFYLAWGFNYYRQPLFERIAVTKAPVDSLAFRKTFELVLDEANAAYLPIESIDKSEIDREIEAGFNRVAKRLRIDLPGGKRKPKTLLFNIFLDKTLTNGFFSPLFHEIHVNANLLPVEYPFTLAHEKCHQMGIASEAEANFLAYLVCASSDNPVVQYSAKMDILGEFLGKARLSLADYPDFREKIEPGIVEDFQKINNRWREHIGAVSQVSRQAYDNYLKANKIAEGVENYSGVVEMVVLWRMRGRSQPNYPAGKGN